MELMIVARKAFQLLGELGIEVARCDIGAFFLQPRNGRLLHLAAEAGRSA